MKKKHKIEKKAVVVYPSKPQLLQKRGELKEGECYWRISQFPQKKEGE